jgi:hypothetical protein
VGSVVGGGMQGHAFFTRGGLERLAAYLTTNNAATHRHDAARVIFIFNI